jgi:hypothetical protein
LTGLGDLALLHLSLLRRVGGDLAVWLPGWQWGGLLNVIAILLFVANTVLAMRRAAPGFISPNISAQQPD